MLKTTRQEMRLRQMYLQPEIRLMQLLHLRVKVSRVPFTDTVFTEDLWHTVLNITDMPVQMVPAQILVRCSKARRWPDIWDM